MPLAHERFSARALEAAARGGTPLDWSIAELTMTCPTGQTAPRRAHATRGFYLDRQVPRAATHAAAARFTINIYYIDGRDGRGVSAHIIKGSSKGAQASTPTSDDSDRKKPPR